MIRLEKHSEVYIHVVTDKAIAKHLLDYFSFLIPNARFHPMVKNKIWDGRIKLYNIREGLLYLGLLEPLVHFCEDFKYEITHVDDSLDPENHFDKDKLLSFFKDVRYFSNGVEIHPRKYQLEAIHHCVKYPRTLVLSPTSSGKSLIIYTLLRWWRKKTLIIVPTTNLVAQLASDFAEYSFKDSWDADSMIHQITAGVDKLTDKPIVVSTWQSLYKQPAEYFDQYEVLIIDEVHLAQAKSLTSIAEKCSKAKVRYGFSGTISESKTHKLVLEGLFGPLFEAASTKELMDKNYISKLSIVCLLLKYPDEIRKSLARAKYPEEIDFLVNHKPRNQFICNLALKQAETGNVLILFNRKKHGEELVRMLQEKTEKVSLIYGGTHSDDRELIRKKLFKADNNILVASFGVFSTGSNLPNLQSLIFAHPYRSEIKNLQSIGRVLRLDGKTDKATLFDVADDLSHKKWVNYVLRHWSARIEIYNKKHFDYSIFPVDI